ncbi:MAG TPA: N-acetylglucosamine-6-phosphate deacetylase [Hanamia sp.]|nr:N-acetylglucosamine-6-phosphate deacetylase [Hanamia sp.]
MMYALRNFCYYRNGQLVSGDSIIIKNEKVKEILPAEQLPETLNSIDLKGNFLTHGFIDLQVNGGNDSFFPQDLSVDSLEKIYEDHLVLGTTNFLPTMITSSLDEMLKSIEVVRSYMESGKPGVLGLHLEGPFINVQKKGAHNEKYIRKPTKIELETILNAGEGVIKMMTIAPELFDKQLLDLISSRGIVISAGHSNATMAVAKKSFEYGVSTITHLYNAMSQFNSREPGMVGAALDSDVYSAIIVDGFHCDYAAVNVAYRLKQGKLFLVSDATLLGNKDTFSNGKQYLYKEGKYLNEEGNLAGSNIAMIHGVANCIKHLNVPVNCAFEMANKIPAKVLNLTACSGTIDINQEANMVILSKEWNVAGIVGRGVYREFTNN